MQNLSVFCLLLLAFSASAESISFLQQNQLSITPKILEYGTVQVGSMEGKVVSVTNIGSESITLSGAGGGTGPSFISYQSCQGVTLSPNESCQMFYNFTPLAAGPVNYVAQGSWNDQSFYILLRGTGAGNPIPLTISPTSFDFGTVELGDLKQMIANVTNAGNVSVVISGTGGAPGGPFNAYQNCNGATLNPGESCQMFLTFSPTADGPANATSQGTWRDLAYSIPLTGTGTGQQPNITIAPTSLDFGDVKIGTSKVTTVDITNYSNRTLVMNDMGGGLGAPFDVSQTCQGRTLNPGQMCQFFFNFTPTATGPVSAVSSGTMNTQPYQINVKGNGVEQEVWIA